MIDDRDRKLLAILQTNADASISELAEQVALSVSACWRRVNRLHEQGFVLKRIALLDRRKMNVPTTVYMMIQTSDHSMAWLEQFRQAVLEIPEIIEVYRLTGNVDYLLKIVLPNVEHLDHIYKRLVNQVNFVDVSSYISMEEMKATTTIPTDYA